MCLTPKFKKFNWFVKLITFNWPAAITLAPFGIYVNQKYYDVDHVPWSTENEELTHWQQQLELGVIFFYILYLLEWIIKLFIYGKKAYENLSSEREARLHRNDMFYLEDRKRYDWLKYIFKKP